MSASSENASGGISISTGWRRPRCTRAKASCTASGISVAESARRCHAVIGRTRSSWSSISWSRPRPLPMPSRLICPATKTTGDDARERGRQPRTGVVHPHPRHDEGHAGAASAAGVPVGEVGGALLVPGGHELDRRLVVEAVDRVHGLVAGQAEHVADALAGQLAGERPAARHGLGHQPYTLSNSRRARPARRTGRRASVRGRDGAVGARGRTRGGAR